MLKYKLHDWIDLDKISLKNSPDFSDLTQYFGGRGPDEKLYKLFINRIIWKNLCENPNAIDLLESNPYKIDWYSICKNPNAISLLEKNIDKIDNWTFLSENPNAIHILEKKY